MKESYQTHFREAKTGGDINSQISLRNLCEKILKVTYFMRLPFTNKN